MKDHKVQKTENASPRNNTPFIGVIGFLAPLFGILMYVSYIPQIINNLEGLKGHPLQPLVATINCVIWVIYGYCKSPKDIPVALSHVPGILFGLAAFITAV